MVSPHFVATGLLLVVLVPACRAASEPPVAEPMRQQIVRTLEALEKEWFRVYDTHDVTPLQRLIADDFVATLADGAMRGKEEHIAAYRADFEALDRVDSDEVSVRVHTPELAVVTGLYTAKLRGERGVTRYRYTDTWLRRGGRWQCVATHESRIE